MELHGHAEAIDIRGLTADSRKVQPGFLFAALPGTRADGGAFVDDALRRGAAAILMPPNARGGVGRSETVVLTDENPRRRYAQLAARFFGEQPETVVAVTGTNGKTSVVSFARQIWSWLGIRAASLGTMGLEGAAPGDDVTLTTPDAADLHRVLAGVAAADIQHLAMEASSHGLAQHRLDGVVLAAAAFTNLGRDHLDYHPDVAAYLAAKTRLFADVMVPGGAAVLNADIPEFAALRDLCRARGHRVISYGRAGEAIRLEDCQGFGDAQRLRLEVFGKGYDVILPLVGGFQVANALTALGLVLAVGGPQDAAVRALADLRGVRGRLQMVVRRRNGAPVYVDYAHKPDALETVLATLRPVTAGRLIVVFGCGGDRDAGKRAIMGEIGARMADLAVVTDDNPRTEDPADIRKAIMAACPGGREIGDRGKAIRFAVAELDAEDVLLIAGKGHETGQLVGDRCLPFDDAEIAIAAVAEVDGVDRVDRADGVDRADRVDRADGGTGT